VPAAWNPGLVKSSACLAIDFFSISDAEDQNNQAGIFDLADEPEIARPISPELSETCTLQGFPDTVRIVEAGYAFIEKLQNEPAVLLVEFA
jgi:hypothetical protein